jgi:MoaA/NifB/PqqE/SkfB family radical SAM enzyme
MSTNENILKQYVCKQPFEYLDIQSDSAHICCPSWCPTDVKTNNGKIGWDDTIVKKIRKSVLDGSYKYCDKNVCPSLNKLLNTGVTEYNSPLVPKDKFLEHYPIKDISDIDNINSDCKHLLFGFDRSCNLKCPSCRDCLVPNDRINTKEHINKVNILNTIETKLAPTIESILITGSGDPFYSNLYRNYLINFDKSKYPNLKEIKIITNGNMLDEKLWNSLKSKEYIKTIEVSIDAGTESTYENVTRLNGTWKKLMSNLNFLSTLNSVSKFYLSFVVSELNYMEMGTFYDTISNIFKGLNYEVVYRQHVYWADGKYTEKEVNDIAVFNPTHSKHNEFLEQLQSIYNKPNINHNFNHLVKKNIL